MQFARSQTNVGSAYTQRRPCTIHVEYDCGNGPKSMFHYHVTQIYINLWLSAFSGCRGFREEVYRDSCVPMKAACSCSVVNAGGLLDYSGTGIVVGRFMTFVFVVLAPNESNHERSICLRNVRFYICRNRRRSIVSFRQQ